MILKAIFEDGEFILGERNFWTRNDECWGTHHLKVIDATNKDIIGREVAIPVTKPKYWIVDVKEQKKKE